MLPSVFYLTFFKFMVCFSPVFALLVSRLKMDRKYFVISQLFCGVLTVFFFFDGLHWIPSFNLSIYMVFMMLNLVIFNLKFGSDQFSRTLAISLFLTFLTTEVWEFAPFVYGYLGLFGNFILPFTHPLDHIYVILCFCLAVKLASLRLTKVNVAILIGMLLCSFLFFGPTAIFPVQYHGYNPQFYIMRAITFASFATVFYFWSDTKQNE